MKIEGVLPRRLLRQDDVERLNDRIEPTEKKGRDDHAEDTMLRGLNLTSEEDRAELLKRIKRNGYGARPGYIAESWSGTMRTAKEFSAGKAPMILVCEKY